MKKSLSAIISLVFWLWNSCFLLLIYIGILPFVGWELFLATLEGLVPLDLSLTLCYLVVIPTACVFLAATKLSQKPQKLLYLFYGVEAPLVILCLLRLFVMRELTAASMIIMVTISIAITAFAYYLFYGSLATDNLQAPEPDAKDKDFKNKEVVMIGSLRIRREYLAWLQLGSHTLMGLVGIYAATILLFYALPLGWTCLVFFFGFTWVSGLWQLIVSIYSSISSPGSFGQLIALIMNGFSGIFWVVIFLVLLTFSATLFVGMPSVYGFLYAHTGWLGWQDFIKGYGKKKGQAGAIATLTAWSIIFLTLQQQPQIKAFNLLEKSTINISNRQELVKQADTIRQGLLNSYLFSYRYLSTQENNHIAVMYKDVFHPPQEINSSIQAAYNQLMTTFLYQGDRTDIAKAEKLYGQFFDSNIQKAEAPTISKAVQATWNRGEAKAGLLNVNQQKVWLKKQAVNIAEHEDWAEVELYEMYENQTPDLQEVFYSFSLPESAVITGLWLGDTDDRTKRFPYQVSPRGAAQEVYNDQVRERVDPALLEQVGTRQYRLRAFPIPAKSLRRDLNLSNPNPNTPPSPTHMHLWLTYRVMQQPQGWAMPDLGEKRNVFWNSEINLSVQRPMDISLQRWAEMARQPKSDRTINGKAISSQDWFPAFVTATKPFSPQAHQVEFSNGEVVTVKPLAAQDYILPQKQRFAVIIDTSRSMEQQQQALSKTWDWLKSTIAKDNEIHLYLTGTWGAEPRRIADLKNFDLKQLSYFGSLQFPQMLQQFSQLQGDTIYDAVLLLTDDGSYDLAKDAVTLPTLKAPLWMVHLAGLPPAYDDVTLKAIQDSGGGVSTSAQEVMQRLATSAKLGKSLVSLVDGYGWYRSSNAPNPPSSSAPPSSPTPTSSPSSLPNNSSSVTLPSLPSPLPNNSSSVMLPSLPSPIATPSTPNPATSKPILVKGGKDIQDFAPLAVRQLALALSQETKGKDIKDRSLLTKLDGIHALAKQYGIVTPYSSMIVLVNDQQREALKKAEARIDRFDREVETGSEALTKPSDPFSVPAVPEPKLVIFFSMGAVGLMFWYRSSHRP